ncbi:MAG TPA: hypothetical protein VNH21_04840 [Steroidobacteraceae bacterium]|nr:hypothetical protein [Steroidobacteraceae bacterium]
MPLDNTARPATKPDAALRYHAARELASAAEKEKEAATKAAVKSGVLFDHRAEPEPPGTTRQIYDDGVVRIMLRVVEPIEKLDGEAFSAALLAALPKQAAVIKRLLAKATVKLPPAHTFTSSLVG